MGCNQFTPGLNYIGLASIRDAMRRDFESTARESSDEFINGIEMESTTARFLFQPTSVKLHPQSIRQYSASVRYFVTTFERPEKHFPESWIGYVDREYKLTGGLEYARNLVEQIHKGSVVVLASHRIN